MSDSTITCCVRCHEDGRTTAIEIENHARINGDYVCLNCAMELCSLRVAVLSEKTCDAALEEEKAGEDD